MMAKQLINRLGQSFFSRDVLVVAPDLLGKVLVRQFDDKSLVRYVISEVEAYRGEEDAACHAHKGRTERTEVMYHEGGHVYVYLIYGMYWLLNFVTGEKNDPQAVLIRGVKEVEGPGRLGRALELDKSFYGELLSDSERIWVEDDPLYGKVVYDTTPRIGIDYAPEKWRYQKWRFVLS
ncbi:DNA-3-methyladenine glycosylase [Carboxylicivirga sp. RSCT41]|uniref:DNA-3-methyladenine glycosylase n=1 Tax=Carboxylicivirga agarovorans TaxID=3417570 RepID=UPI003D34E8F8